jgi:hypothetical protein
MGANLLGLMVFDGTGVGHLGVAQMKLSQQVENLTALHL